ncbi:MAG: hypothetical protein NUW12_04350 [Firmicutes bacterium]|jgi:hypothetical protein|nr:hypothetical protein [Bacillota bacterium]MDH7495178.1 hypothetical protein [Bacillota bacterium]
MKRMVLVLALMAVLLVPAAALAYNPGVPLPDGAAEVETWYLNNAGQWVSQGTGNAAALARCWSSGPASGACNAESWVIDVTHHASVAQWIDWSIGGTRWDWRIRKPGTYAADCINFTIKSNNDVAVQYDGFADLAYLEQGEGVKQTIDTYYSYGATLAEAQSRGWVRASALNDSDDLLEDSAGLHAGLNFKLWNKIVVENCNSSCEYEDTATITLVLQNVKHWIDAESGNFAQVQQ